MKPEILEQKCAWMRQRQQLKKLRHNPSHASEFDSPFDVDLTDPAPGRSPRGRKPSTCACGVCPKCRSRAATAKSRYFQAREVNEVKAGYKTARFTKEEDEILKKVYQNIKHENNAAKKARKLFPDRTPSHLFRRAAELGLIRRRERYRWTEEELRVVEASSHLSLETIQRRLEGVTPLGFKRTRSAIAGQIHANRFRTNLQGLNFNQLSEALGISIDTLRRYLAQKMIRGKKIPSIDQHKDKEIEGREGLLWFFPNYEVLMFILRYPGLVDLRRVNQSWFMSLMEWGSRFEPETGRSRHRKPLELKV